MISSRIILLPLILTIALYSVAGNAARKVNSCSHAYLELAEVKHDSSVELEMLLSDEVLNLLTTKNGKLGGLLAGQRIPDEMRASLAREFPGKKADEILWEDLSLPRRRLLLREEAKSRESLPFAGFYEDRAMRGMKVKELQELHFDEPTEFLGKNYEAGTHYVDMAGVLGKVEYMGPENVLDASGVELHFRARVPAGQASHDARTFLRAVNVPPTAQHVHVVAKLPVAKMKRNPALSAAAMGDFFRRGNLLAEFIQIFNGGSITEKTIGEVTYFKNLRRANLAGVTTYFEKVGLGKKPAIGDSFKMGWIGMRGSDKYDQPGLWGIEYRNMPAKSPNGLLAREQTLDALQWSMEHQDYGLQEGQIERWLNHTVRGRKIDPASEVAQAWYRGDETPEALLQKLPKELQNGKNQKQLAKIFAEKLQQKNELRMLLHNWDHDPLFFENESTQGLIKEQQKVALLKISSGENISGAMQNFLWDSGLAEAVASSLNTDFKLASKNESGLVAAARSGEKRKPATMAAPETEAPTPAAKKFWRWITSQKP